MEPQQSNAPKHNYQRDLDYIIRRLERTGEVPTLLLHACCAPCSSYTIEYLSQYFKITLFYYNPNIAPDEEYRHRVEEIKRFVAEFKTKHPKNTATASKKSNGLSPNSRRNIRSR